MKSDAMWLKRVAESHYATVDYNLQSRMLFIRTRGRVWEFRTLSDAVSWAMRVWGGAPCRN